MEGTTLSTRLILGRSNPRPKPRRSSHDEVSTVLALWDPTWPTSFSTNNDNNTKRKVDQVPDQPCPASTTPHDRDQTTNSSSKRQKLVSTLSHFPTGDFFRDRIHENNMTNNNKNTATKEEQMKRKKRDELVIANLNFKDSWGIKKKLTARDLRHFYMPASLMNKHILPHVDDKFTKSFENGQGAQITFHDGDTHTTHHLYVLKQSDNSYVLVWHPAFVKRRQLKEGDEIGLHWFKTNSKPVFLFSLLERGNQTAPCTSWNP
ncbi:putative B3 domain-containing protein At1g78640 [Pyrus x bretschneideri]|uniref:putative B3 domain-containing protein At1g78640 n=1 Tax=Pyrus x bretschneideri TaxID=225117 RepID=UPI00202E479D|nr:putative B3 domain-containing protein At1g78640 [Pyrus x bretschneideri]